MRTETLQLSAINIQLKDTDRVFRLYIKSLGDKAVYRVEESAHVFLCRCACHKKSKIAIIQ